MYVVEWKVAAVREEGAPLLEFDTLRDMWRYVKARYPKAVIWGPPLEVPFARPYTRDFEAAKLEGIGLQVWSSRKAWDSAALDPGWPMPVAEITDTFEEETDEEETE